MKFYAFADFGPSLGGEAGENIGQERVECGADRPIRAAGAVRKFSQEPQITRGNWRDQTRKKANRKRLTFLYWWDGVYHTKTISV